jgi:hypothetical protein
MSPEGNFWERKILIKESQQLIFPNERGEQSLLFDDYIEAYNSNSFEVTYPQAKDSRVNSESVAQKARGEFVIRVDQQCRQDIQDLLDIVDPLFPDTVLFLNVTNDLINFDAQKSETEFIQSSYYCRLFRFETKS